MGHALANLRGKRILIRVDGSHSIGLGHVYRMKTLASELRHLDCRVVFVSRADAKAKRVLEDDGFECCYLREPDFKETLHKVIQYFLPDVIVQDVLATSKEDMTAIRDISRAKTINFDDSGAGSEFADAVINAIIFHWESHKRAWRCARQYEGSQYMILNPIIAEYTQRSKDTPLRVERILLAFGGTDTHHITERILKIINRVEYPLSVSINLGPGAETTAELESEIQNSSHRVSCLFAASNLYEEFFKADVVVCAGGVMLYELAAMGVPSISIPAELHEVSNVAYWTNIGATLGLEHDFKIEQVSQVLHSLIFDHDKRLAMSVAGKNAMDVLGLNRVLSALDEVLS